MVNARPATTLAAEIALTGVGLHTGRTVTLRLKPEHAGRGLRFVRVDLPGAPAVAAWEVDATSAPFRTALKHGAAEVHTVEHALAALAGLGVTDCTLEIDGLEVPGLDGSALPFAQAIRDVGLAPPLGPCVDPCVVSETITIEDGPARIEARRHDGLKISYRLDYPGNPLAQGSFEFELSAEAFLREIAPARTFVMLKDAEAMRKAGYGKGANTQNTVVIDGARVIDTTLRFPDEPVRHKILDLIGDLYVLGRPVYADIRAHCSGHRANRMLAQRLRQGA